MGDEPTDERARRGRRIRAYSLGIAALSVGAMALLVVIWQLAVRRSSAIGIGDERATPAPALSTPTPTCTHTPVVSSGDTRTAVPTPAAQLTQTPQLRMPTPGSSTSVPQAPTSTPTPTPTPTSTPVAPEVPMLPLDEDVEVVVLLGIDEPMGALPWRTDSIILAFVQWQERRIALLSMPRDMWVYIPVGTMGRVNTVDAIGELSEYPGGGPAFLDRVLRINFGIPVHHYVRVDFAAFVRIIDAIGGITIDVEKPLGEDLPEAGPIEMDGELALKYARSRRTTSDFDRSARQRQVLLAVAKKALSLQAIARAPELWEEFRGSIETDLSIAQAVRLALLFQALGAEGVRSAGLDQDVTEPWTTPDGAQVLLPDRAAIQQLVVALLAEAE
ncbi:MAG: LCP family protein [Anaerolineae bacterium]|nr:LCP family protein [Anaerolineae bacterium]